VGNTYEQGESRRGEERIGKETERCPLTDRDKENTYHNLTDNLTE
jgi:hypothetical protein